MRAVIAILLAGALVLGAVLQPALAGASEAKPLVDAEWLHANLDQEDLVVLDVRNAIDGGSAETFAEGHIPGAVYSNYLTDGWRVERGGIPGQLPPVEDLEKLIGGLGISNDDHVVVVAAGTSALDMGSATRVYWTFKVLGHDRVSVLNGGLKAYDARYDLAEGTSAPEPATFAAEFRPELIASREEVAQSLENGGAALMDNRPAAQYRGESKHPAATRAGTIPQARNVPESALTVNGGTFVDPAEIERLLQEAGLNAGEETIAFCNTGHWASLGWFARHELLGDDNVRVYDGSMVEWTNRGGDTVIPD